MYFPFFKLKKWGKRRLRLAGTIVRCCPRVDGSLRNRRLPVPQRFSNQIRSSSQRRMSSRPSSLMGKVHSPSMVLFS